MINMAMELPAGSAHDHEMIGVKTELLRSHPVSNRIQDVELIEPEVVFERDLEGSCHLV